MAATCSCYGRRESNPPGKRLTRKRGATPMVTEREFAISVVRRLHEAGFHALWAGGCVRDEYLGLVPKDYDVATDARPEQVKELFPHHVAVGEAFGVVKVLGPRRRGGPILQVEIATFRTDVGY